MVIEKKKYKNYLRQMDLKLIWKNFNVEDIHEEGEVILYASEQYL